MTPTDLSLPLHPLPSQEADADPQETQEWVEALNGVVREAGA